ncbi:MAG: type II and III secretion system protein family protein [Acidobacteriota bacterium]
MKALGFVRAACFCVVVIGAVVLTAQTPTPVTTPPASPAMPNVTLTVGRSLVLPLGFNITRVAITNPAIADATVVTPREILLDGKSPGTVSLIVWGATERSQYDVVVDPGVTVLQRQLQTLFPGEDIQASETVDSVILMGRASTNSVMLRAGEIAGALAPKAKVTNLLQLPGGNENQQVLLQVRIAEVNRRALSELGASMFTGGTGFKNVIGRSTTEQFPAPTFDKLTTTRDDTGLTGSSGDLAFTDFLNLFLFSNKYNVGMLIRALQSTGNFQSLAEPNLIAYNGKEASFLAGGQLPVPIVQGNTGQVTIEWKEFGVRLNFTPTVAGDMIRLKVKPEVSSLDFANGITLGGFRVPALSTRRAETEVELRDGQSFAIGGLMNNTAQETRSEVPWLSRIPIVGKMFQSKATTRERTELLVLVTPHLVRALDPDGLPPLPISEEKFLPPQGGANAPASAASPPPAAGNR